jgi:hypothetical protein
MGRSAGSGPAHPQDRNRSADALNTPLKYTDPPGHWVERAIALAFIASDLWDSAQNGLTWENGLALAADVASLALPAVAGGGAAVRALAHADDAADALRAATRADEAADAAHFIEHGADAHSTVSRGRGPGAPLSSPDKPFIVTPEGATLPPHRDYNLVDRQQANTPNWMQIHGTHDHAPYGSPHTHLPEVHRDPITGRQYVRRTTQATTASDINRADAALRSGELRHRVNRSDRGGPR